MPELPRGEPLQIRSGLSSAGERSIQIQLSRGDSLIGRALQKCDAQLVRFLVCATLSEYLQFHRLRSDAQAVRVAILHAAELPAGTLYWGLGLAGRLANSPFLKSLDTAAIYGPAPPLASMEACRLGVKMRVNSDLPAWQPRGGQAETTNG
jgi:hypothetical protein